MLSKGRDLEQLHAVDFVDVDEAVGLELAEEVADIAVVVWEQLCLDPQRPALHPAFAVSQAPEAGEQQTGHWLALCQELVFEKRRLKVSRPCHVRPLLAAYNNGFFHFKTKRQHLSPSKRVGNVVMPTEWMLLQTVGMQIKTQQLN